MERYEPGDDLCSVCRGTILVSVSGDGQPLCPNCEDWRRKVHTAV